MTNYQIYGDCRIIEKSLDDEYAYAECETHGWATTCSEYKLPTKLDEHIAQYSLEE